MLSTQSSTKVLRRSFRDWGNFLLFAVQRKRKIDNLKGKLGEANKRLKVVDEQVQKAQLGREESVSWPVLPIVWWIYLHVCCLLYMKAKNNNVVRHMFSPHDDATNMLNLVLVNSALYACSVLFCASFSFLDNIWNILPLHIFSISTIFQWRLLLLKAERSQLLAQLAELKSECASLTTQVQKYRDCDPEVLEEVKRQTVVAKDAANRWTGEA